MRRGPNLNRRKDLEAAIARAQPDEMLTLSALALAWGSTKTNFVNVKANIADFPTPVDGPKNSHLYPARDALEAMLRYERRNDAMQAEMQQTANAILGRSKASSVETTLPVSELATLSRLAAEVETRERDQGLWANLAEMASTAGQVFASISGFLGSLANEIDPNGQLPPETRTLLDQRGRDKLLSVHGEMKYMLSGDAAPRSRQPTKTSRASRRARPARA